MFNLHVSKPAQGILPGSRVCKPSEKTTRAIRFTPHTSSHFLVGASATALGIFMLLPGGTARANNECGTANGPNPTIICDGIANNELGEINVDPVPDGGDTATHASGIFYNVSGLTLNLDGTGSPLNVVRPTLFGVWAV